VGSVAALFGLEAFGPDRFEAGDELAQATVVVDPALVFGGLLFAEVAADGFVGDFAGPLPVGAVWAGRVGLAGAAGVSAAGTPLGDRAREHLAGAGDLGEFGGDLAGLLAAVGIEPHRLSLTGR
jgi:hypothetical protein